ncbi:DoxX family protein [bacterium]|nr:DoxX family protein [bacterium]
MTRMDRLLLSVAEVISRLVIGWVFVESGWGKLQNLRQVVSYFGSLGIPFSSIQAPLVAGVELGAGMMILIGYKARFASIPLAFVMLVALATAKWQEIDGVSSLFGLSELLYFVVLLWLAARKSDALSFDSWLSVRKNSALMDQNGVLV